MTLTCERLPDRTPPVSLLWDWWTFGESLLPLRPQIESAATAFAARLTADHPLPAVPAHTAFTEWGPVAVPETPAGTIRVYVGPAPADTLGASGPAGALTTLPRYGAASLGINPAADWSAISLPTVVRHELLHAVGVLGHSGNQAALMAPGLPAHTERDAHPSDLALAAESGWDIGPPESLLHGTVVHNPWGMIGWARLSPEMAAGWWRAGNLR